MLRSRCPTWYDGVVSREELLIEVQRLRDEAEEDWEASRVTPYNSIRLLLRQLSTVKHMQADLLEEQARQIK